MRPTLELLGELAEQTRSLAQVELSLVRAELSERGALVSSSLTKVGAGLVCLPIGLALFLVAVSLALRRFGIPADLAFLIVALFVIAAGAVALDLWSQRTETEPARSLQEYLANLVSVGRASGWR